MFGNFCGFIFKKKMSSANDLNVPDKSFPQRRKKVSNVVPLCSFVIITCTLLIASAYAFQTCMPSRFYRGFDSWGNVCGGDSMTVAPIASLNGSGQLKTESRFVWQMNLPYFSLEEPRMRQNSCTTVLSSLINDPIVNVCANNCPNSSSIFNNVTSYESVLHDNGYHHKYVAAQTVLSRLEELNTSCQISET